MQAVEHHTLFNNLLHDVHCVQLAYVHLLGLGYLFQVHWSLRWLWIQRDQQCNQHVGKFHKNLCNRNCLWHCRDHHCVLALTVDLRVRCVRCNQIHKELDETVKINIKYTLYFSCLNNVLFLSKYYFIVYFFFKANINANKNISLKTVLFNIYVHVYI